MLMASPVTDISPINVSNDRDFTDCGQIQLPLMVIHGSSLDKILVKLDNQLNGGKLVGVPRISIQ